MKGFDHDSLTESKMRANEVSPTVDSVGALEAQSHHGGGIFVNGPDDGLEGWKQVQSRVRHAALGRTASVPVSIPRQSVTRKPLEKTVSHSPDVYRKGACGRIMYDRDELLSIRYSPQSMTPPKDLSYILEATKPLKRRRSKKKLLEKKTSNVSACSAVSTASEPEHADDGSS